MTKRTEIYWLVWVLVLISKVITAGGVTVGNGKDSVVVGFSLKNDYRSEGELKLAAQEMIESIQEGSFSRLQEMERLGQCDLGKHLIKSLKVESFLPLLMVFSLWTVSMLGI
jgi:hypothetical protein